MFFTRLALATLSLSSAIKVFAAPVEPGVNSRRDVVFVAQLNDAKSALLTLKTRVDGMIKKPGTTTAAQLTAALEVIPQVFGRLNKKLKTDGKKKDALLLDADGVTKLTPKAFSAKVKAVVEPVDDILKDIEKSSLLKNLESPVKHIKAEVTTFGNNIKSFLPGLSDLIGGIFGTFVSLITHVLGEIFDLITSPGSIGGGDD